MTVKRLPRRALLSGALCSLFAAPAAAKLVGSEASLPEPGALDGSKKELGGVVVQLRRFRNVKGKVRVGLYRSAADWPKAGRAFRAKVITLDRRSANVVFKGVPYGPYAVAVLHDEDGDGDMDYNIIGVPTEGFGFTRDAPVRFGPPDFEDARVVLGTKSMKARIKIRYML